MKAKSSATTNKSAAAPATDVFNVENWVAMGAEAMRFLSDRLQQDVATQQALLQCKSIGDIQAVQASFIQTAMDQYLHESTAMIAKLQGAIQGITPPTHDRTAV